MRQLAAVELRKRISAQTGDLWIQVPAEQRNEIKSKLPELILAESRCVLLKFRTQYVHTDAFLSNLVRHSTARVIAAIASIEVPLNQWNELLPFLEQTCRSPTVAHREVGVYILYTVLENIVDGFESQIINLFKLFEVLLVDPESAEVRITTVRALGVIAQYIEATDKPEIVRATCPNFTNWYSCIAESVPATSSGYDQRYWAMRRGRQRDGRPSTLRCL